jgi:ABC-type antimicrobial peptide transport system permease subunit
MLKALGARNRDLYLTVLAQAMLSVTLGFGFGLAITLLLALVIPIIGSNLTLEVSLDSLVKVATVSLVIAAISAMLPIRQIAGLDPAMVFRGR